MIKEILFELKRKGLWGFVRGKKIRRTGGRGMVTQIIQILCHWNREVFKGDRAG